jgi:glycosyltransferase 2 family protein
VKEPLPPDVSPPPRASPLRRLWQAAAILVVVYLAWRFVDFRQVGRSLSQVSLGSVLILMVIVTMDRFLMAFKWKFIAHSLDVRLRMSDCLKAYYTATIVNFIIPSSLGGDLNRALRVSRGGQPMGPVFATIVMEKVVKTITSVACAWIAFAYLPGDLPPVTLRLIGICLGALTIGVGVAVSLSVSPRLHGMIGRPLRKYRLTRIVNALDKTFDAYRGFARKKLRFVQALLIGIVETAMDYSLYAIAAVALNVPVSWAPFLAVVVLNNLLRKLALYLNSWSVLEAAHVAMFGLVGISPAQAVAISLLRHAAIVVSTMPGVAIFLQDQRRKTARPRPVI